MTLEISIDGLNEDKCEVIFTASADFHQEEKQTLEYPGDCEHFEIDEITWDESLYTPDENKIIESSLDYVDAQFDKEFKVLKKDREEEMMENKYDNL